MNRVFLGGHDVPSRSPVLPAVPEIPHAPKRFLALPPQIEEEGFDQVRFLPDKAMKIPPNHKGERNQEPGVD